VILFDIVHERLEFEVFLGLSLEEIPDPQLLVLDLLLRVIQLRVRVLPDLHLLSLSDMRDHALEVVQHIIELLLHLEGLVEALGLVFHVLQTWRGAAQGQVTATAVEGSSQVGRHVIHKARSDTRCPRNIGLAEVVQILLRMGILSSATVLLISAWYP